MTDSLPPPPAPGIVVCTRCGGSGRHLGDHPGAHPGVTVPCQTCRARGQLRRIEVPLDDASQGRPALVDDGPVLGTDDRPNDDGGADAYVREGVNRYGALGMILTVVDPLPLSAAVDLLTTATSRVVDAGDRAAEALAGPFPDVTSPEVAATAIVDDAIGDTDHDPRTADRLGPLLTPPPRLATAQDDVVWGEVVSAGGGWFSVLLDRDTQNYPTPGGRGRWVPEDAPDPGPASTDPDLSAPWATAFAERAHIVWADGDTGAIGTVSRVAIESEPAILLTRAKDGFVEGIRPTAAVQRPDPDDEPF